MPWILSPPVRGLPASSASWKSTCLGVFAASKLNTTWTVSFSLGLRAVITLPLTVKFQEWILLMLRCLVVLLLVLALARPMKDVSAQADRSEAVDAVFVFDTSYSMGAADRDKKAAGTDTPA